jgi:uncharacterized protein (DUF1919 family)
MAEARLAAPPLAPTAREAPRVPLSGPRAALLRALAADTRFSVISNNCWGAHVYQSLGIAYATPFIGLFIPPADYLELAQHLDTLIGAELTFMRESRSASVNEWRSRERLAYPIGLLGGRVEIDFQHYRSEDEARSTWRRRCARIHPDPARRFFKFDDREGATAAHIAAFAALGVPNKLCFTVRRYETPTVLAPAAPGEDRVLDGVSLAAISRRSFNTLRWISALPRWLPLPSLV